MKKKILMFVFNKISNDVRVLKTCASLQKLGYQVDLYGITDLEEKKHSSKGVDYTLIPCFSSTFFTTDNGSASKSQIILSNVKHYLWNKLKLNPSLFPDIIYSHDMSGIGIGGFLKEMLDWQGHPVRWVHDLHEYVRGLGISTTEEVSSYYLGQEEKYIYKADHLLTVSSPLADLLHNDYKLASPPSVILNTPVMAEFNSNFEPTIRDSLGLAKDIPLAVYSGGITPVRGIECLIDAVALHGTVHLVLVANSNSEYMLSLIDRAKNKGLGNRFHIHPYVSPNDIPSFLSSATMGIHPIREYGNSVIALPNKLFDYLHAKIPVVVSNVKTMADFVNKENVGRVFKVDDPKSLCDEIDNLLNSLDEYKKVLNSRDDLLREYSWESQEKKLEQVMNLVCRKN